MIVQVDDLVCIRRTACHIHFAFLVERYFRLFQHAIGLERCYTFLKKEQYSDFKNVLSACKSSMMAPNIAKNILPKTKHIHTSSTKILVHAQTFFPSASSQCLV